MDEPTDVATALNERKVGEEVEKEMKGRGNEKKKV